MSILWYKLDTPDEFEKFSAGEKVFKILVLVKYQNLIQTRFYC